MKTRFKLIPTVSLILRQADQVLLLRRAGTGYQDGHYGLVSGHLEGDELGTAGIVREAAEEAGIIVRPQDLTFVHLVHRLSREREGEERADLYFEAREWAGEITNREPTKCDDLSWHPLDHLPPNTVPLVRHVLADVARGVSYSEYTHEPV